MKWKQIWTVFAKEVTDAVRDRRTLISMIVFPAVIIPGLMFGFGAVSYKVITKAKAEVSSIMLIGAEHAPELESALKSNSKITLVAPAADYREKITQKQVRAAVEVPAGFAAAIEAGESVKVRVYTYEGEMKSGFAAGEVDRVLREHREAMVSRELAERSLPATFVKPFEIARENVAPPEKVGGSIFGGFVPYMIIILTFVGAMYPAIDLTAGEKERGTMETILCSPVGRAELVLGKFFTVLTISMATVLVSVASLAASGFGALMFFQKKMAAAAAAGAGVGNANVNLPMIDPVGVLCVFLLIIPVAVMFSAVLFTTALFAKSHKEAQTYVTPLMMVIMLPSIAALLPGVELNAGLALIPILNVSLLSKDLVSGTFPIGTMSLTFISSCLYGLAALLLAVKMFNRESVIFRT